MESEKSTVREILPSLLISLCGLLFMSVALSESIDSTFTSTIQYMFILTSMLSFKNNIELNYADIMSSTTRRLALTHKNLSYSAILEYVFDCGAKMFTISSVISIIIGMFSGYKSICQLFMLHEVKKNILTFSAGVAASFLAGVCGSIATFFCVISCILLSIVFDYNPDNIMLPIIAASADYVSTVSLSYFSEHSYLLIYESFPELFKRPPYIGTPLTRSVFLTNCLLVLVVVLSLAFLCVYNRQKSIPPLFNVWSLCIAFFITMVAGYVVDRVSQWNKWMGMMIPLFNGICGSVALVYTSKITTYSACKSAGDDEEIENPRSTETLCTLLTTTLILSLVASISMWLLFTEASAVSVGLFAALIIGEVFLLYNLVNAFVAGLGFYNIPISCHVVPLLNASSDLLGSLVLGAGALALKLAY
ncbi:solute carrier family 41 [Nematocida displodere]|uniref:Solute carrier family 41 n=1 Tax=Nematocida displodere TaxID=1805483 RepID=A0A177EIS5_9MICR|nr:solute carrier family 41 [Nematocida displodere]